MNIAKFLRTPILKNICKRLFLFLLQPVAKYLKTIVFFIFFFAKPSFPSTLKHNHDLSNYRFVYKGDTNETQTKGQRGGILNGSCLKICSLLVFEIRVPNKTKDPVGSPQVQINGKKYLKIWLFLSKK